MLLDLMLDQRKFASLKPQRLLKMIVPRREPHCRQGLGELDLVTLDTEAAPALPFRSTGGPVGPFGPIGTPPEIFSCAHSLSAVSTYETDLAVLGREDFWLIVAFRGSEDETEIHSG